MFTVYGTVYLFYFCVLKTQIFALLYADTHKIAYCWTKNHAAKHLQSKWLHALSVVLYTLNAELDWLEVKIFEPDDLAPLQGIAERVKTTLSHLFHNDVFDSKEMCTVLSSFLHYMEKIGSWHNSLTKTYFAADGDCPKPIFVPQQIKRYSTKLNEYFTKYGIELKVPEEREDDEEEEEDEGKEDEDEDVGKKVRAAGDGLEGEKVAVTPAAAPLKAPPTAPAPAQAATGDVEEHKDTGKLACASSNTNTATASAAFAIAATPSAVNASTAATTTAPIPTPTATADKKRKRNTA